MDRAAIQSLIQAAGYGQDPLSSDAQHEAMSAALLELAAEREWSWLLASDTNSLTVGSEIVGLPADFVFPKAVLVADPVTGQGYEPLSEVSADTISRYLWEDAGTDLPTQWGFFQRTVLVYPRPNRAYEVRLDYVKEPDPGDFDSDGESPDFATQFHPVVAWGALRWLAIRQRDWAAKQAYDAEYQAAKLNFSQADRRGEPDRVKRWAGWDTVPDPYGWV